MSLFSIAWNAPDAPEKGFKHLYLIHEDWLKLQEEAEGSVRVEDIEEDGELRHKIAGVIGFEECLKGSGLIAGETSRASDDIFTITLVTTCSVGISTYLVPLGERADRWKASRSFFFFFNKQ